MLEIETLVTDYLIQEKIDKAIVIGGLDHLVKKWERLVTETDKGMSWYIEDYRYYLYYRGIIADIFAEIPQSKESDYFSQVNQIDDRFKHQTVSISKCLDAPTDGKDMDFNRYWFYYRKPKEHVGEDWPN